MKVKKLTLDAVFVAIIAIMAFIPVLGFIPVGGYSVTILTIPVIVYGMLGGFKKGLLLGTAFGFMSLIIALIRPAGYFDVFFQNPIVSILPRILFGIFAGLVGELIKKWNFKNQYLVGFFAFILSLLHSILVLTVVFLLHKSVIEKNEGASIFVIITAVLMISVLVEALMASIIVPFLYFPLKKVYQMYFNKN